MVKGKIAETLAEELFRDLGFYVMKFGKEHTINPLIQLESFIKGCDGKFKLEGEDYKYIYPVSYLNKLPDFIIVHKEGNVDFLEVRFRKDACLWPKDNEIFEVFPEASMLVVNLKVDDSIIKPETDEDKEELSKLKATRLHVWERAEEKEGEEPLLAAATLKDWLSDNFEISNDELLEKYEKLVKKWMER